MAYEKQEWKTGDTITAEKLNNMENGIDSQPFIMLVGEYIDDPDEGYTGNHILTPLADFKQAIADGKPILLNLVNEDSDNETIKTYTYTGKHYWVGIQYYIFACPEVSKYDAQSSVTADIDYIIISMNGDISRNSVFLTTR